MVSSVIQMSFLLDTEKQHGQNSPLWNSPAEMINNDSSLTESNFFKQLVATSDSHFAGLLKRM